MFIILVGVIVVIVVAAMTSGRSRLPLAIIVAVVAGFLLLTGLRGTGSPEGEEPSVTLLAPLDGTTLTSPVTIEVEVENAGAWHPHAMVDAPCVDKGETVPADSAHLHLGAERVWPLDLPPGRHTLCLQLGDRQHRAREAAEEVEFEVKGS